MNSCIKRMVSATCLTLVTILVFCANVSGYEIGDYTWYEYNGHQYAATFAVGPWDTVQAEAAAIGANLVAINDAAENAWVSSQFAAISESTTGSNGCVWIGLYQDAYGEDWQWSNGDPVDYWNPYSAFGTPEWGPHCYLHTDIHSCAPTWNNNKWHDYMPDHYLHGVIEIPEPATLGLLSLGGFGLIRRHRKK
ncbi:MAG: PEP-CTERM sorting domain-containing protein [Phycisphaerae bacterium]|nr:PEP-CTERM sorting domain-containing protein [Phycisphaerae bacterium]